MSPEEERDFMRCISSGDRSAFRTIIGLYMSDMYRFALSVVGDTGRAEDITQEACIRLWTKAGSWNGTGRLKQWLFSITYRLCIDEIRVRKSHSPLDEIEAVISDPANDPHQALSQLETADTVREALMTLPKRQRAALMLVHYSGFSNPEAATILKISVDALESLLSRGRTSLKSLLNERKNSLLNG